MRRADSSKQMKKPILILGAFIGIGFAAVSCQNPNEVFYETPPSAPATSSSGSQVKAKPMVKSIIRSAEEKGMLLLSCGTYDNTLRWIPPLNVTSEQINDGLAIFGQSLKEVLG